MDDERLIAQVHDSRDSVASLQGCHGARNELTAAKVFHRSMVVAMLDILRSKEVPKCQKMFAARLVLVEVPPKAEELVEYGWIE